MDQYKLNLLTTLSKSGDKAAMLELADHYYMKENKQDLSEELFQMVFDYYTILADAGNDHAMVALGSMYYEGVNIPQDFKLAKRWYEKAAECGNPLGINNLGYCYYYGRDIPVNLERAFHLFGKAAQLGHHNGMYKLGDMYYNGHFIPKDSEAAFYWYIQAEKIIDGSIPEYPNVAYRIGHCYFLGKGATQNFLLALEWLQKAELGCYIFIQKGDAFAHLTLVRVKEDLAALRQTLEAHQRYQWAELGYHNPLNL